MREKHRNLGDTSFSCARQIARFDGQGHQLCEAKAELRIIRRLIVQGKLRDSKDRLLDCARQI